MVKKTIKNKQDSERDRFTVVLESIQSDFQVFGEKLELMDEKNEDFREKVDERFNAVDYKFEMVFDELRLIRNELKEKVGRDEFLVLEKRVMALEKSRK